MQYYANMKSLMPNLNQKLNMEIWLKSKYNTLSKCYRIHAFKNPKDLKALMGPCTCPKLGLTKYSYCRRQVCLKVPSDKSPCDQTRLDKSLTDEIAPITLQSEDQYRDFG